MPTVVSLTTDFGTADWFVGAMKAVIAGIAPDAHLIDITHGIAPGDIRTGALALRAAVPWFPPGSIHVAVVDPGVGSERRAIAIRTPHACFIGPDNGLLTWAATDIEEIRILTNTSLFLQPVSHTFHGRDIFAPVAAHLAAGHPFSDLGPAIESHEILPWPTPVIAASIIHGEVVHVDHFGNAITNIPAEHLPGDTCARVTCGPFAAPLRASYAAVAPGEPVAVRGSTGLLELAVRDGSAATVFGIARGAAVEVAL